MFIPDYMFDTVYDIPVELFAENGIKCLFLDIDNTLVPYEIAEPTKENLDWFEKLQSMGITLFFVSNNHADRVDKYAKGLGIKYEYDAGKPFVKKYKKLAAENGIKISECACIGDQIFTDVWAADILGIKSFLVLPINDVKTKFNKFKRFMEKPFVKAYKRRQIKLHKKEGTEKK